MKYMHYGLKALGWLVVALAGLAAAGFAALIAANWNDDALSEAAQQALHYTPPTEQALQGNGYLILMGLDAPAGNHAVADAVALGRQRLAREIERRRWVEMHGSTAEGMPVGIPMQDAAGESVLPTRLRCPVEAVDCMAWYARHQQELAGLFRTQAVMLQRLADMNSAPQFSNPAPAYLLAEFAPFGVLVRAHELWLAQASLAGADGQHQQAMDMARQAVQLRRRMAAGADHLVAAMIAIAMQHRELRWLSAASAQGLQSAPAAASEAIEALLSLPTESLAPALAGEMRFVASGFYLYNRGLAAETPDEPLAWWQRLPSTLAHRAFLANSTLNLSVGYLQQMQTISGLPAHEVEAALSDALLQWNEDEACALWKHVRNPVGRCMATAGIHSYQGYVQRVADIDGYRRLVLLQHRAAAERIALAEMPAWLAKSPQELRNPYTQQPMQWDAASQSLVFEGREKQNQNPGQSSTYRVRRSG
jgi:hypothetical protein